MKRQKYYVWKHDCIKDGQSFGWPCIPRCDDPWNVEEPDFAPVDPGFKATHPTHAEAITYATEQATRQALAASFTIPPENPVARAMQEA